MSQLFLWVKDKMGWCQPYAPFKRCKIDMLICESLRERKMSALSEFESKMGWFYLPHQTSFWPHVLATCGWPPRHGKAMTSKPVLRKPVVTTETDPYCVAVLKFARRCRTNRSHFERFNSFLGNLWTVVIALLLLHPKATNLVPHFSFWGAVFRQWWTPFVR